MTTPLSPISNPDNPEPADRYGAELREERALLTGSINRSARARCRSTAERQTEVMDDRNPASLCVAPMAPARPQRSAQWRFGARTGRYRNGSERDHQKQYDPLSGRQIRHASSMPAMDTTGNGQTQTNASGRPDRNNGLATLINSVPSLLAFWTRPGSYRAEGSISAGGSHFEQRGMPLHPVSYSGFHSYPSAAWIGPEP